MINRFELVGNSDFTFLRNDYPCNVVFDGDIYPSAEHAFQAAKTQDLSVRMKIKNASMHDARKIGKKEIVISNDWDDKKLSIMKEIQKSKYNDNLSLKIKLLLTEDKEIVQGGAIVDLFWGKDDFGNGENHFGKILMEVRQDIKNQSTYSIDAWAVLHKEFQKLGIDNLLELKIEDSNNAKNKFIFVIKKCQKNSTKQLIKEK